MANAFGQAEVFRKTGSFVLVEAGDEGKIGIIIAGRIKIGAKAALFSLVVEKSEYDGYAGIVCKKIKSAFPVTVQFAGTFGGDGQNDLFPAQKFLSKLMNHIAAVSSVNGDSAH